MASQHFDFTTQQGFPQTPSDALTIVRNSEAFSESADGQTVTKILANKLQITDAGLTIWEPRTNVVLDSSNFTAWNLRGPSLVNDRNQLAPDGSFTASDFIIGAAGVRDIFKGFTGLTAIQNHEVSFWIKRSTTTGILLCQKTTSSSAQTGQWNINMSLLPDTFVRLTENHPSVTIVQNFKAGTTGALGIFFASGDAANKAFTLWGVQMEEGPTVSPHIETLGATATSSKDVITQDTSQMGFGADEGMIVIDLVTPAAVAPTSDRSLFSLSDGTTNNRLLLHRTGGTYRLKHSVPGQSVDHLVTGINDLTSHKIAVGWTNDGKLNVSVDGGTVQILSTAASSNFIPQANFTLGSDQASGSQLNSIVKSLTSYPDYLAALLQLRSTDRIRAIATNYYRRQGNG